LAIPQHFGINHLWSRYLLPPTPKLKCFSIVKLVLKGS
jgi:hypothetical protein